MGECLDIHGYYFGKAECVRNAPTVFRNWCQLHTDRFLFFKQSIDNFFYKAQGNVIV